MILAFVDYSIPITSNDPQALNEPQRISYLISQNGVALTSTVFGMMIRIVVRMYLAERYVDRRNNYLYIHPTPEEIDLYVKSFVEIREVVESFKSLPALAKDAEKAAQKTGVLSGQLTSLSAELKGSNDGLTSTIESIRNLRSDSESVRDSVQMVLDALLRNIKDHQRIFAQKNDEMQSDLSALVQRINDTLEAINPKASELSGAQRQLLQLYSELNDAVTRKLNQVGDA